MDKHSRCLTRFFCLVFVVNALCFCGCDGPKRGHKAQGTDKGVRIGMSAAPKTLDPRLSTDVASARVQQLVFNSLVKKNQKSEIVPDLAESWELVDDTTYRFTLRKGVRFHDGSPLTTRDVKATFDAVLSDTLASPRKAAYDKLASINIVDDHIIEFRTTEPFAPFLINMVMGILPESQAQNHESNSMIKPIGTGPFTVSGRLRDDRVVLTAFADHFNGKSPLDWIEFRIVPDDSIRVMELEKGSIDFIQNDVPPDAVARLRDHPDLAVMTAPGTSYFYMGFNFRLKNHPTSNPMVRKALAKALNRDEIIEHVLGGLAEKATGVLPAGHWAFSDAVSQIEFDAVRAAELLDEAGYRVSGDNRFQIEFKVSQNKHSIRLAEVIQAQWAAIGVKVVLRSLEWGTFYEDILKGNFETYVMSWVGVTDPDIYHSIFHSGSIPPNGRNRGQYQDPRMDEMLDRARVEMDDASRALIYREIQALVAEDLPYISLWHSHNVAVMNRNLINFHFYPAGDLDSFSGVTWRGQ